MLAPSVLVALGGVAGVLARYWLSIWIPSMWTVAAINLAGSFALGAMTHLGAQLSHDARNAIGVGLIGGLTTFSTLTVQTVLEAVGGKPQRAAAYFLVTVLDGLLCAVLGYVLFRRPSP